MPEEIEVILRDWDKFKRAITAVKKGTAVFHAVNQTLGYNLAKAIPSLVGQIKDHENTIDHLRQESQTLYAERSALVQEIEHLRESNLNLMNVLAEKQKVKKEEAL